MGNIFILKNVKINLGRRAPPLHPNMGNGQKKKCFLWKVFPQSHTKSNFKMNYENMNYGKNKIDCNDGHSSMSGHFCIYDLHKNVIQQQISKSITL